jgi:cell division protease FtsH
VPYEGRIDKIRQANQIDNVANISVHESGHAVVYMALTGMVPLQLKSKVASSYAGGFTFPHQLFQTRASILNKIKIYLAGGIAEELVFGAENASTGRVNDRIEATTNAIEYIRKYGFDAAYQSVYNLEPNYLKMDQTVTDNKIEELITRLVDETRELLTGHLPLLRAMSRELRDKGSLESAEIVEIGAVHGLEAKVMEEGYMDIVGYNELLGDE